MIVTPYYQGIQNARYAIPPKKARISIFPRVADPKQRPVAGDPAMQLFSTIDVNQNIDQRLEGGGRC